MQKKHNLDNNPAVSKASNYVNKVIISIIVIICVMAFSLYEGAKLADTSKGDLTIGQSVIIVFVVTSLLVGLFLYPIHLLRKDYNYRNVIKPQLLAQREKEEREKQETIQRHKELIEEQRRTQELLSQNNRIQESQLNRQTEQNQTLLMANDYLKETAELERSNNSLLTQKKEKDAHEIDTNKEIGQSLDTLEVKAIGKLAPNKISTEEKQIILYKRLVGYFNICLSDYFTQVQATIYNANMKVIAQCRPLKDIQRIDAKGLTIYDYFHIAWNIGYILKQNNASFPKTRDCNTFNKYCAYLCAAMFDCKDTTISTIYFNLHDYEKGKNVRLLDCIDPLDDPELDTRLQEIGVILNFKEKK